MFALAITICSPDLSAPISTFAPQQLMMPARFCDQKNSENFRFLRLQFCDQSHALVCEIFWPCVTNIFIFARVQNTVQKYLNRLWLNFALGDQLWNVYCVHTAANYSLQTNKTQNLGFYDKFPITDKTSIIPAFYLIVERFQSVFQVLFCFNHSLGFQISFCHHGDRQRGDHDRAGERGEMDIFLVDLGYLLS